MNYGMREPCKECPFLIGSGFPFRRLTEFASGEFACHKACDLDEDEGVYKAKNSKTPHCAGALIFNEKRNQPSQMMRICERLGMYDHTKLNMAANVGSTMRDYPTRRRTKKSTTATKDSP